MCFLYFCGSIADERHKTNYIFIHNEDKQTFWVATATLPDLAEKNVTNRELARRLGISEQQIGKYVNERDYPSLKRLHEIAEALDLRVKDLFEPID